MRRPSLLGSHSFSVGLASRILAVVGVATLAAHASCAGNGGAATTGSATTGSGGSGNGGIGTGAGGSSGALVGFDASLPEGGLGPPPPGTECFDWPADAGDCPTDPTVIIFALDKNGCNDAGGFAANKEASAVVSGPTHDTTGQCCYVVDYQWCVAGGRPYLVGDQARTAPARRGHDGGRPPMPPASGDPGWSRGARPLLEGLGAGDRAALAAAWTADALLEHASVASFARFSLALLAAGAPAELVELAHRAALDEVRHAELCFALATAYAGEEVGPGPFPAGDRIEVSASLVALAAGAVREGCVGETIAAVVAAEQASRATDPAVGSALAQIAADEARHAELAWRTVAWAIEAGGSEVREAVAEAFRSASAPASGGPPGRASLPSIALEAHGRLDPATTARVAASAIDLVVGPCARALQSLRGRAAAPAEVRAS